MLTKFKVGVSLEFPVADTPPDPTVAVRPFRGLFVSIFILPLPFYTCSSYLIGGFRVAAKVMP